MRVLIVDDEPLARAHLRGLLESLTVEVLAEADSATKALEQAEELRPDLLFVDIKMPGMTGLQLAEALQELEPVPLIVFVTAYSEYAVAAFEHDSVDYLVKPVSVDRLERTLARATERLAARDQPVRGSGDTTDMRGVETQTMPGTQRGPSMGRLPIREDYSVRLLRIDEIVCAVAREKRVFIRTPTAEHRTYYTLKQLETLLPSDRFFRVHDSYIVRLDLIKELHLLGSHSYSIRMESGLLVPVSRTRYKELQRLLGMGELVNT